MGEIKKQSINNTFLSYTGACLGFLIIYIQPHLISSSDIGLLRLLYSFSWMAAVLMPLGTGSITLRFFPKIKNEENTHNGLFALLLLSTSIGALVVATLLYLNRPFFADYYRKSPEFPAHFNEAIVFAYILSLISIYSLYSSSLLKTSFPVFLTDIFTRLGQMFIIVIYHYGLIDKNALVLCYIGVFFLQLLLLLFYLLRNKAVSFKINWSFFKSLDLREVSMFGMLMMLTAFASMGIKFIDQLLVGHFLNENMVGVYATAVMICAVMEIPFNSLDRIAQPKISYAWHINDRPEVEKIYELSSRYMFFAGGLLFCLLIAGIDLIFLFLPQEYQQGKMAFYIVACASLINLLTGVNSSVILYSHKYFAASVFLFVMILVSFFANNMLIGPFGLAGAAAATLVATGCYNLLKYFYILARFRMQPFSRHTFYILVCIIISTTVVLLIPAGWGPLAKAIVGAAFTTTLFTIMNFKFNTVEEVNKVLVRLRVIKKLP